MYSYLYLIYYIKVVTVVTVVTEWLPVRLLGKVTTFIVVTAVT